MTGLVYKECKQNLKFIIASLTLPALIAYLFGTLFMNEIIDGKEKQFMETVREGKYEVLWLSFLLLAFISGAFCQGMVLHGDDRKLWAYFVASSPDGIKGYLRVKYELIFIMVLSTMFSLQIGGWIMTLICASYGVHWPGFLPFIILVAYLQIMLRGIEIPFTLRFGEKNGSTIKLILLLVLSIAFIIIYAVYEAKIMDFFRISDRTVDLLLSFMPIVALVTYYLSYRLSCRLYMKGAEQYDK